MVIKPADLGLAIGLRFQHQHLRFLTGQERHSHIMVNAKDAVIELCGGVGKILVETKSGNAALSIQSEYVDIKGVHESVLETSSSSGSCIAGAVDDSFVVNTYSDANNKANFDIGNGSIILESKKKGYQAEVEFYGCGWSGGVYTGAFAPTKAYSEKIMLGDSGRVWERLIVKNSPQVTSDRRAKTNIFPLGESKINKTDIHSELFDRLKPVQYRMIDGDGRICYGFVAQDVVEAMRELGIREDELDLVHHDRKNTEDGYIDTYSMVYTNLIAVITHELQLEKERRSNLEIEVADLRSELESMRDNISGDTQRTFIILESSQLTARPLCLWTPIWMQNIRMFQSSIATSIMEESTERTKQISMILLINLKMTSGLNMTIMQQKKHQDRIRTQRKITIKGRNDDKVADYLKALVDNL